MPIQLDSLATTPGGVDDFRLDSPPEVHALLKRLLDASVPLHLTTSDGASYTTTLWAIDSARGVLSFSADAASPALQRVLQAEETTAVGYLDSVKVQFDVQGLMLVHGARDSALNAQIPREMFRFQRRNGFRVRTLTHSAPTAHFAHPMIPDMQLALRVLDISIGGCALHLPDDVPPLEPGVRINGVELQLDAGTHLRTALVIHHVFAINPESRGVRLGCELVGLTAEPGRLLQLFIDQIEKRRRMLALD